jgi:hypothetical protein
VQRRAFIGATIAGLMGLSGWFAGRVRKIVPGLWLRPPGALPEAQFSDACVRCT